MSVELVQHAIAQAEGLYNAGRFADAVLAYREILQNHPENAQALNNLGNALKNVKQLAESVACYRRAIALRPDVPQLHYNLASVLADAGEFDKAITEFEHCLRERPDFAEARHNYAGALRAVGRLHESVDHLRRAGAMSDLLYLLHFMPESTAQSLLEAHSAWGRQFPQPAQHPPRAKVGRLRIGYVSPDFRSHCQANFLLPLLSNHDHSRFEIFAYDNTAIGDELGEKLLSLVDHRRSITRLSDADADSMIRGDQIDILVDLTLHMAGNRLPLLARKPARVQITWLGYPGTTGLAAIDYRLSDAYIDPPGRHDADYVERTIRLPDAFWCYDPIDTVPASPIPPVTRLGHITFGCLNNFAKITDETITLWSSVMWEVPGSQMILLAPAGSARRRVADAFEKRDVASTRITFVDRMTRSDYLRRYHQIDIALDTVPYGGHTTTLDALWMATPVITRAGVTAVSRGGASILHHVGLDELITYTGPDFVKCAVELATNSDRLAAMRLDLRERMERSPLVDARRFARNMEAIYEQVAGRNGAK